MNLKGNLRGSIQYSPKHKPPAHLMLTLRSMLSLCSDTFFCVAVNTNHDAPKATCN